MEEATNQKSHAVFYWILVVVLLVVGFYFGAPYLKKTPNENLTSPQPIGINIIQDGAVYDFDKSLPRTAVASTELPAEVSKFVYLYPNSELKVEKVNSSEIYYATYKSEGALVDNYFRLAKTANSTGAKIVNGKRSELGSLLEIESANYEISISQLSESEEKTEVTMYAKKR